MKFNFSFLITLDRVCAVALSLTCGGVLPVNAQTADATAECSVLRVYTHQADGSGAQSLHCELLDYTRSFTLQDIPDGFEQRYAEQIIDGSLVVVFSGVDTSSSSISFLQASTWSVRKPVTDQEKDTSGINKSSVARKTVGERSVLIVQISAPAHPNRYSEAQLSDFVFGTSGDTITMQGQFSACSFNQLSLVATPDEQAENGDFLIKDGVTSVMVENEDVKDVGTNSVRRNAMAALVNKLDGINRFDHIMFAVPPGGNGSIAVAAGPKYTSYRDTWASSLSAHMHELGHNFGLGHAGEGGAEYGDATGYMGFSQQGNNTPVRCFNGSKSSRFGWYEDNEFRTTYSPSFWNTRLFSLLDFGQVGSGKNIILKIESPESSTESLYLSFNRSAGINSGTPRSVRNKVNVVSDFSPGKQSSRLASLAEGEEFVYPDFGGVGQDFVIQVGDVVIDDNGLPDYAQIRVKAIRPEGDELCVPVMAENNRLVLICL